MWTQRTLSIYTSPEFPELEFVYLPLSQVYQDEFLSKYAGGGLFEISVAIVCVRTVLIRNDVTTIEFPSDPGLQKEILKRIPPEALHDVGIHILGYRPYDGEPRSSFHRRIMEDMDRLSRLEEASAYYKEIDLADLADLADIEDPEDPEDPEDLN